MIIIVDDTCSCIYRSVHHQTQLFNILVNRIPVYSLMAVGEWHSTQPLPHKMMRTFFGWVIPLPIFIHNMHACMYIAWLYTLLNPMRHGMSCMHDIILCMCRMIIGIYMHVRACHDTVHDLYIQTLPQVEVYKQSTAGDMVGTSYPKNWKSSLQRSHASNCKFLWPACKIVDITRLYSDI